MSDDELQARLNAAMAGHTGQTVAIYRDSLIREKKPVVGVDAGAEANFVHVSYADGSRVDYAHEGDLPLRWLEAIYLTIPANLGLLDVSRH